VVILADPPEALKVPPMLRATLRFSDVARMINRNFFVADRNGDAEAVRLATDTLRHIAEFCEYEQAKALARMYLRILARKSKPNGAA
jgi:hypothetical protein